MRIVKANSLHNKLTKRKLLKILILYRILKWLIMKLFFTHWKLIIPQLNF